MINAILIFLFKKPEKARVHLLGGGGSGHEPYPFGKYKTN